MYRLLSPCPPNGLRNTEKGTYDTSSSNLVEKDCRECHGYSVADRHHGVLMVVRDHLCSPCHMQCTIGEPECVNGITIHRNCLTSGCHDTNVNGGHHVVDLTNANACITCHNPNLIGELNPLIDFNTYPPQVDFLPTPFSCENCHMKQTITAKHYLNDGDSDPDNPGHPSTYNHYDKWGNFIGFYEYPQPINSNLDTHHIRSECATCHLGDPNNLPCDDPMLIRYCERCHSIASLHSINSHMSESNGWEAVADPDGEASVYRAFTANEKCLACHGGEVPVYSGELLTKPAIVMGLEGIKPKAGSAGALVTIRGQNFTDKKTINRTVELRPTGSFEPWKSVPIHSWTDTMIEWSLPCWRFASGNYDVTVKTEAGRSNKRVFTVEDGGCCIIYMEPRVGPYGTWITVGCLAIGDAVSEDGYNGVRGLLTFSNTSGTWIATKFMDCGYDCMKVRFQNFYQDKNGNYIQDLDEPFSSPADFLPGDYEVRNKVIYFGDEDDSGNFSPGDIIFEVIKSDPVQFELTNEPYINKLNPKQIVDPDAAPYPLLKIYGGNFGMTKEAGNSVRIGTKATANSSTLGLGKEITKIPLWSDTLIKVRVNAPNTWRGKTRYVWVEKSGKKSNYKPLYILSPLP